MRLHTFLPDHKIGGQVELPSFNVQVQSPFAYPRCDFANNRFGCQSISPLRFLFVRIDDREFVLTGKPPLRLRLLNDKCERLENVQRLSGIRIGTFNQC